MVAATVSVVNAAGSAVSRVIEPVLFAASGSGDDVGRARRAVQMLRATTIAIVFGAVRS